MSISDMSTDDLYENLEAVIPPAPLFRAILAELRGRAQSKIKSLSQHDVEAIKTGFSWALDPNSGAPNSDTGGVFHTVLELDRGVFHTVFELGRGVKMEINPLPSIKRVGLRVARPNHTGHITWSIPMETGLTDEVLEAIDMAHHLLAIDFQG